MIKISNSAAEQIRNQCAEAANDKLALRLAAKPDGKGGISYAMGFDTPMGDDTRIQQDGFELVISPESEELLIGTTLDYVEFNPGDFRFIFVNPNDPNHSVPSD